MNKIGNYVRYLNIDIAIGAGVNCYFFQWITGTDVSVWVYILLFNSIWSIYTLDRILDSGMPRSPETDRHLFHKKHQRILLAFIVLLFIMNIWVLLRVEIEIVKNGIILAGLILFYLFALKFRKKFFPKEIFIAIFYTVGISLGPLTLSSAGIDREMALYLAQHTFLAFINLLIFSLYETSIDQKSGQFNIVLQLGRQHALKLLRVMMVLSGFLIVLTAVRYDVHIAITYSLMLSLLIIVSHFREFFNNKERYRFWADAAFLLPIWIWVLQFKGSI